MVLIVAFHVVFGTTFCGVLRCDLNDFEMIFQKGFGKEMHEFCKGFGKCFPMFSVYGETKRLQASVRWILEV